MDRPAVASGDRRRVWRVRRPIMILLVTALLTSACAATAPSPTASPSDALPFAAGLPTPDPNFRPPDIPFSQTPLGRELAELGPDGSIPRETALRMFALVFGPLPGVDVAAESVALRSSTLAIRAVYGHWDELTEEQRAAVEEALRLPPDVQTVEIGPVAESGGRQEVALAARGDALAAERPRLAVDVAADAPYTQQLLAAIRAAGHGIRQQIAAKLDQDIPGTIPINIAPSSMCDEKREVFGCAPPKFDGPGGAWTGCEVRITGTALAGGAPEILNTLGHEIFHCFQEHGYGTRERFGRAPAWVVEGGAEWVGNELTTAIYGADPHWNDWFLQPGKSLMARSYDAVGFWAHLAESGVNPYDVFPFVWQTGDGPAAFRGAGAADNVQFLDSWGSGVTRRPDHGPAWDTDGPAIPEASDAATTPDPWPIGDGDSVETHAEPYTVRAFALDVNADILQISGAGHARIGDTRIDTTVFPAAFCVRDGGCPPCPDDPGVPPAPLSSTPLFALTGGVEGSTFTLEGLSLEDECERTPQPTQPRPDPGEAGGCTACAMSNGDPHLLTVDEHPYDFQAAGEFVLLRSADGAFELQGRQEPYGDSGSVTINTAIAMRVGDSRVVIAMDEQSEGLVAAVDGVRIDLAAPPDLGGGAAISSTDNGLTVTAPDGTAVHAIPMSSYGINVLVDPSDDLRSTSVGVLGPVPDGSEFPALPDGTVLPQPGLREEYREMLYGTFADAWRVTAEGSLFDYAPGESTETFTLRDYPREEDLVLPGELTPEQRAAGEAACAPLRGTVLFEQCVFDVGITSDIGFATGYERTLNLVDPESVAPSGGRIRVVNVYADDAGPVEIDVYVSTGVGLETAEALVATVPYGAASGWFDPGFVEDSSGGRTAQLTFRRRGVQDPALAGWSRVIEQVQGRNLTVVIATGEEGSVGPGGGRGTRISDWDGSLANFPPLDPAYEGSLLAVDTSGLANTRPDLSEFYASVGDGCLTAAPVEGQDPSLPPVPKSLAAGFQSLAAIEAGSHTITFHLKPPEVDIFSFGCDTEPITEPAPLEVADDGHTYVFLYAPPGEADVRTVALPFGP